MSGPKSTSKVAPPPPYWVEGIAAPFMFEDFPEPSRQRIYDTQLELDRTCPEWRIPTLKIGAYPVDTMLRIRWLLKRHELLTRRTTVDTGNGTARRVPAPCDWEVLMRVLGTRVMALPLDPAHNPGWTCADPTVMRVAS